MRIPPPMLPAYAEVRPPSQTQPSLSNAASAVSNAVNSLTDAGLHEVEAHMAAAAECPTCDNRRYQDDSLDSGVSFQNPTHISPQNAASAVFGHEREHQSRERMFAEMDGREIIMNEIQVFTSLCPDCGRIYVSGGVTRTQTREAQEENQPMSLLDVLSSRPLG